MPAAAPDLGIILGSGWADATDDIEVIVRIPNPAIPAGQNAGVAGHPHVIALGRVDKTQVLVFAGRRHWYEGLGWDQIAFPIHALKRLGARAILLTNAGGGINPALRPGDLMVIDDHINATGVNPLVGPHDPFWGPRFPDMSSVYDPALRKALSDAGLAHSLATAHGIYAAVSGPSYETPAEIRALRAAGADAVGMSTVPEAILANAAGLRVAGLTLIANHAGSTPLAHTEVLATTHAALPRLKTLLAEFIRRV